MNENPACIDEREPFRLTTIPQYPDYSIEVSKDGTPMVWSIRSQQHLTLRTIKDRLTASLCVDGRVVSCTVPRLVMMAKGVSLEGRIVEMIRPHDYHPDNLKVVSKSPLSAKDAQHVRYLYHTHFHTASALAQRFQVSRGTINDVVSGRSWPNVPWGPAYPVADHEKYQRYEDDDWQIPHRLRAQYALASKRKRAEIDRDTVDMDADDVLRYEDDDE